MALCVCGNGNDILWDPPPDTDTTLSPFQDPSSSPLTRPDITWWLILFLWLILLTAMIWGRAGHPVSHPECTGGIKVGVGVGGGPHRRWGSFCQHWERVNIEESWVSSLDRGGKRCQWAGKLSSLKIVSIQNRARVGHGPTVENELVIDSFQI